MLSRMACRVWITVAGCHGASLERWLHPRNSKAEDEPRTVHRATISKARATMRLCCGSEALRSRRETGGRDGTVAGTLPAPAGATTMNFDAGIAGRKVLWCR